MADGSMVAEAAEDSGGPLSVDRLRRQYLDFSGTKSEEIAEQRQARHYYHGDQYTAKEVTILKKRRQPVVTSNRIGRKIDGVVGLVERLKQDPKAYARTPQHEQGADLATATLRYALDVSEWAANGAEANRNGAINGIGGVELLLTAGDRGDPDIDMMLVDADTFFYDPRSYAYDFSDARFMGVAKWMDLDQAKEMFPAQADQLDQMVSSTGGMDSVQQQDREKHWVDTDEERVFLVEHWYINRDTWHWCFYVGNQKLEAGVSPFVDEKGKTFCRFIMFSSYVDQDGDRYGFVRNMKTQQDEINQRRSKALHLLNTRRIIAEKGAVDDKEKARTEAARGDGYIEVNPNARFDFDDVSSLNDMQGQMLFLEESKAEIDNFGPNPQLTGQGVEKNQSGRAIALLQQAGVAELGPYLLSYRNWKVRVYRAVWNIIQQHWQGERWIRVTDDEGVAKLVQINGFEMDEHGRPRWVNALGALDVDIIVDEGPDNMNAMQDSFDILVGMGPNVPWQVIVEMSPLPVETKKQVLAAGAANQEDPVEQARVKAELENAQADTAATKAKSMKDITSAMQTLADISVMPEKAALEKVNALQQQ